MNTTDKLYLELSDISKQRTQREAVAITEASRIMATTKNDSLTEIERLKQVHDRALNIFKQLTRTAHINRKDGNQESISDDYGETSM